MRAVSFRTKRVRDWVDLRQEGGREIGNQCTGNEWPCDVRAGDLRKLTSCLRRGIGLSKELAWRNYARAFGFWSSRRRRACGSLPERSSVAKRWEVNRKTNLFKPTGCMYCTGPQE